MIKNIWTIEEILEDITKQLDLVIDNNNKDRALLITRIKRKIRNINKLVKSNKKLHEENEKLKKLIKECERYIDCWGYYDSTGNLLFPQIEAVLGEKK